MSKKTMSPYTPLNKTKEIRGTLLTYKSPNIDMSKRREEVMMDMRRKMEQNSRSPMLDSGKPAGPSHLNMFMREGARGPKEGGRAHSSDPREAGHNQNQANMIKVQPALIMNPGSFEKLPAHENTSFGNLSMINIGSANLGANGGETSKNRANQSSSGKPFSIRLQ